MSEPIIRTCEACGRSFSCGGYGCWCGQVAITDRQMDRITATYHDCLCPSCLQKVSRGELASPSRDPGA